MEANIIVVNNTSNVFNNTLSNDVVFYTGNSNQSIHIGSGGINGNSGFHINTSNVRFGVSNVTMSNIFASTMSFCNNNANGVRVTYSNGCSVGISNNVLWNVLPSNAEIQFLIGNSNVFYLRSNGAFVDGILNVNGINTNNLNLSGSNPVVITGSSNNYNLIINSNGNNAILMSNTNGNLVIGNFGVANPYMSGFTAGEAGVTYSSKLHVRMNNTVGGNVCVTFDSNNRLGVNNSNPLYPLDVTGDINFTGILRQNGGVFGGTQWTSSGNNLYLLGSNVSIGNTSNIYNLDVTGTVRASSRILLNNTGNLSWLSSNSIVSDVIRVDNSNQLIINGISGGVTSMNADISNLMSFGSNNSAGMVFYVGSIPYLTMQGTSTVFDTGIGGNYMFDVGGSDKFLVGGSSNVTSNISIFGGRVVVGGAGVAGNSNVNLILNTSAGNTGNLLFTDDTGGTNVFKSNLGNYSGILMALGVSATNNRQLWIMDASNNNATTGSNSALRFYVGNENLGPTIDALSVNGSSLRRLRLGSPSSTSGLLLSGPIKISNSTTSNNSNISLELSSACNNAILVHGTDAPRVSLSNTTSEVNIGVASAVNTYSTSAAGGDMVIRNTAINGRIHLQNGTGRSGLTVGSNNFVFPGGAVDFRSYCNVGGPLAGQNGGTGDKLLLFNQNLTAFPYSIGIDNFELWYSTPSNANHVFYINGSKRVSIGISNIITSNVVSIVTSNMGNEVGLTITSSNNKGHLLFREQGGQFSGNTGTTGGMLLALGVNSPNNRQLWLIDASNAASNSINTALRFINYGDSVLIDAIGTDGTTFKPLSIGNSAGVITEGFLISTGSSNNYNLIMNSNGNNAILMSNTNGNLVIGNFGVANPYMSGFTAGEAGVTYSSKLHVRMNNTVGGNVCVTFDSNNRLGVNNSNPLYPLDVTGDINFTGILRQNGGVFGGTQWTSSGNNLYLLGSNVSIGNTSNIYNLDVTGTIRASSRILLNNTGNLSWLSSNSAVSDVIRLDNSNQLIISGISGGVTSINAGISNLMSFGSNNSAGMVFYVGSIPYLTMQGTSTVFDIGIGGNYMFDIGGSDRFLVGGSSNVTSNVSIFGGRVVVGGAGVAGNSNVNLILNTSAGNTGNLLFTDDTGGTNVFKSNLGNYNGVLMTLGVSAANNRQLWIMDASNNNATTGSNSALRFHVGNENLGPTIDALSVNGSSLRRLRLGNPSSNSGLLLSGPIKISSSTTSNNSNISLELSSACNNAILVHGTDAPRVSLSNTTSEVNIGVASAVNTYSTSAAAGDLVIRNLATTGRLHFQNGTGISSITIGSNNVIFANDTIDFRGINTFGPPVNNPNGGSGDRLIFSNAGANVFPYSVGVDDKELWYSCPSNAIHAFQVSGTRRFTIGTSNVICSNVMVISTSNMDSNVGLTISSSNNRGFLLFNEPSEFGQVFTGNNSTTRGILFAIGYNAPNNRQLWIMDSSNAAANSSNVAFRIICNGTTSSIIDCATTDGLSLRPLLIGNTEGVVLGGPLISTNTSNNYNVILRNTELNNNNAVFMSNSSGNLTIANFGTANPYFSGFSAGEAGIAYSSKFHIRQRGTSTCSISCESNNFVGINDTSPSYQLDVNGDVNFTGTLRQNGTSYGGGFLLTNTNRFVSSNAITLVTSNLGSNVGLTISSSNNRGFLLFNEPSEFGQVFAGNNSTTRGILFAIGYNSPNNRQLWIMDSSNAAANSSNVAFRLICSGTSVFMDCVTTDGLSSRPLSMGNAEGVVLGGPLISTNTSNNYNVVLRNTELNNNNAVFMSNSSGNLTIANFGTANPYFSGFSAGEAGIAYSSKFHVRQRGTSTCSISCESNNFVGINDTSPSYQLDVNGDVNFTGTLRQNGTSYGGGFLLTNTNRFVSSNAITIVTSNMDSNVGLTISSSNNRGFLLFNEPSELGQVFTGNNSTARGVLFAIGYNIPNNRQLWIMDSSNAAANSSNVAFRIICNGTTSSIIDCATTDGLSLRPLLIGNTEGIVLSGPVISTGTSNHYNFVLRNNEINNNNAIFMSNSSGNLTIANFGAFNPYFSGFSAGEAGIAYSSRFHIRQRGTSTCSISCESNNFVGINDTSPSYQLDVSGTIRSTTLFLLNNNLYYSSLDSGGTTRNIIGIDNTNNTRINFNNTGNIIMYNGSTTIFTISSAAVSSLYAVTVTSDERLKTDVKRLDDALNKIVDLNGYSYNYFYKTGLKSVGLIAQEVEKIIPEIVETDKDTGYKSIAYSCLIPYLIESIKELKREIDALKKKI